MSSRSQTLPAWMQARGLEWLFRLCQEPRRLWKRYLLLNPLFLCCLLLQSCGYSFRRSAPACSGHGGSDDGRAALPPRYSVLGVEISATSIPACLDLMMTAIREKKKGYICVTSVHGVIESQQDARLRAIHNASFLTVPDGMPLVWAGKRSGLAGVQRVYGPDLMLAACAESVKPGWTHFLCGGQAGIAEELKRNLEKRFPGIRIVGTWCPPFRPLNEEEQNELIHAVKATCPDILWIGLSTPKQELFMAEYLPRLDTTLMCGVGAAFDIHTGRIKDAPTWVKTMGLQWLYRLCQEPRRLWKRYFHIVPAFLVLILLERLGFRKQGMAKLPGRSLP